MKVNKKIYWLVYKWKKMTPKHGYTSYTHVFVFTEEYPPIYVANGEAEGEAEREEWCLLNFGIVDDENRDYAMLCIKENFGELIRTEKEKDE